MCPNSYIPPEDGPEPSKADLRGLLLSRRKTRSEASDGAILRAVEAVVHGRAVVTGFVPLPGEPGGPGLVEVLARAARRVLLPVLRPDNDLDWADYTGELRPGRLGLREPPGPRLGLTAIASAEVVVVPALAVGRDGTRLGRGGGSYDRALARVPAGVLVVALVDDGEVLDSVPAQPHDHPVRAVITPGLGLVHL